ncbi:MAG: hypothetical protein ABI824_00710, partial [Acidobacteriota bacterium]
RSRDRLIDSEDRSNKFSSTRTHKPRDAKDLPSAHVEVDRMLRKTGCSEFRQHESVCVRLLPNNVVVGYVSSDHEANQESLASLDCGHLRGDKTVPKNRNSVGKTDYYIYNYIVEQYIDEAMLIYAIGSTAIFIGYEIFRKKTLP